MLHIILIPIRALRAQNVTLTCGILAEMHAADTEWAVSNEDS